MKRSLLDEHGALCWRCGWPIYEGQAWEAGHTVPKWLGGKEIRPEHRICNRADGIQQTKARAKTDRIIKKGKCNRDAETKRSPAWRKPTREKQSKLQWDWRKKLD